MRDKFIETIAVLVCIVALIALVWIDPSQTALVVPVILALVGAATAYEGGRRRGKRRRK